MKRIVGFLYRNWIPLVLTLVIAVLVGLSVLARDDSLTVDPKARNAACMFIEDSPKAARIVEKQSYVYAHDGVPDTGMLRYDCVLRGEQISVVVKTFSGNERQVKNTWKAFEPCKNATRKINDANNMGCIKPHTTALLSSRDSRYHGTIWVMWQIQIVNYDERDYSEPFTVLTSVAMGKMENFINTVWTKSVTTPLPGPYSS